MSDRIVNKEQHKDYLMHQQFRAITLVLAIAGVLLFFFGYYLGKSGEEKPWIEAVIPKSRRQVRQNNFSTTPPENTPQPDMPSPNEIKFLDGKILKIDITNRQITFEATGPVRLLDKIKKYSLQRTVILTSGTQILEFKPLKNQQEIRTTKKENLIQMMGGYIKKVRLTLSDLGVGDLISVITAENILREKSFEAIEIRLLKKAE